MSSSGRVQSPAKRLLHELQTYHQDSNEALLHLGPVSDDELMHWTAIMKGVPGTAYEGKQCSGEMATANVLLVPRA